MVEGKAGWVAYLGVANDANPLDNRLVELQQILALAQLNSSTWRRLICALDCAPCIPLKSLIWRG